MASDNPYAPPGVFEVPREIPDLEPPQSIRSCIKLADHLAAWDYIVSSDPATRKALAGHRMRFVNGSLVGAGVGGLLALMMPWFPALGLVILALSAVVLLGALLRLPARKMYFRQETERSFYQAYGSDTSPEFTVRLEAKSLCLETIDGNFEYYWHRVPHLDASDKYLLFYLDPQSPWIVPRDAFNNPVTFYAWRDLSKRLWNEAKLLHANGKSSESTSK